MVGENEKIYEFAEFRLIPGEGLLLNNHAAVDLNPKAFAVLSLLVGRNGHLVSKLEILETVWNDAFIEEAAVSKAVWFIRNALGDTSKEKFIQTVPRRGYRFVAPVVVLNDDEDGRSPSEHQSTGYRLPASVEPPVIQTKLHSDEETKSANGQIGLVSVERTLDKTKIEPNEWNVTQAESRKPRNLRWWAATVGLASVLIGVAAIYIAGEIPARFGSYATSPGIGTKSEEAYQVFLRAENISARRGTANVKKALEYIDQAIAIDPNYARAWAAKAHLHGDTVGQGDPNTHTHHQSAMEAIKKALAIDPGLSEAYSARCHQKNRYEYNIEGAEADCKRALQLDPNSSIGHKAYANFLYASGRFDEAIAESKTAMALEPASYRNQQVYGLALHFARRYTEAETHFKRLLELNPNHSYSHGRLIRILEEQGKESEAFEHLVKKLEMDEAGDETIERYQTAYATSGWRGVKLEQIKTAEADPATNPFWLACLYVRIGDMDRAFEYLDDAYQKRSFLIAVLRVEPQLDPLRNDPRYADLLRRVEEQK